MAPRAAPLATPTFGKGKRRPGGSLNRAESGTVSSALVTAAALPVGTNTSSKITSLLPVPAIPATRHESVTLTAAAGTRQ